MERIWVENQKWLRKPCCLEGEQMNGNFWRILRWAPSRCSLLNTFSLASEWAANIFQLLVSLPPNLIHHTHFLELLLATGPSSFSECRRRNMISLHELKMITKLPALAKTRTGCELQGECSQWVVSEFLISGNLRTFCCCRCCLGLKPSCFHSHLSLIYNSCSCMQPPLWPLPLS
jgi:hypothetical protein